MNILFTICARAGSKGVRNKNIRNFCGLPIVNYTLAAYSLFCEKFYDENDSIVLAINTDSKELIQQVDETNIDYYYIDRKVELAGDVVSKISVINDTLKRVEEITSKNYDYIVDLDLTSPLRTVMDIKKMVDLMNDSDEADIVYSVTDSRRSPFFNMVCKDEQGFFNTVIASDYVCRQQAPECFDMNASIYVYSRAYLMTEKMGKRKALIWKMKDTGILDIDSETDLELMQVIGNYFFEHDEEYSEIQKKAAIL